MKALLQTMGIMMCLFYSSNTLQVWTLPEGFIRQRPNEQQALQHFAAQASTA